MNITNLSKSNQLQQDFQNVKNKLQSFFNTTAIISANIICYLVKFIKLNTIITKFIKQVKYFFK